MNFKPDSKEDLELNITPLVDVVFLLLIFFMVSTTFDRKSEINISLPRASEAMKEVNTDIVNISVDEKGSIFIDDIPLVNSQLGTIREALGRTVEGINEPAIVINADENTTHQTIVKILDAARQLSLSRVTFATLITEEE
ncbi:MAG: biopolymer transporter ExbD [Gammaproteobacteria bacterium]|nr:biopolymer transporter ExbD [Gammaproteobacteria bacterium]